MLVPEALPLAGGCLAFVIGWQLLVTEANAVETNALLLVAGAAGLLAVAADRRWVRVLVGGAAILTGVFGLMLCALAVLTFLVGAEGPDDHATGVRLFVTGVVVTATSIGLGWLIPRIRE